MNPKENDPEMERIAQVMKEKFWNEWMPGYQGTLVQKNKFVDMRRGIHLGIKLILAGIALSVLSGLGAFFVTSERQVALLGVLAVFAFLVQLAGVVVIYYFTRDGQGT